MLNAINGNDNKPLYHSLQYALNVMVSQLFNELGQMSEPLVATNVDDLLLTKTVEVADMFFNNLPSGDIFDTARELGPETPVNAMKCDLEEALIVKTTDNNGIMLKATAQELSEVNDNAIFYIQLSIKEDSMQWAFSKDSEGNINANLVPE